MRIIDISWPITASMTTYKNKTKVGITPSSTFENDQVRKTDLSLDTHTGTHIDAPSHFIKDGATTDQIPLEHTVGGCVVVDLSDVTGVITSEHLDAYDLEGCDVVLIKTSNSLRSPEDSFDMEFVYLDSSAAEYLVESGVQAIGFDYLGVERNQPNHDTHKKFFEADVTVIEGLRLSHVPEGEYFFVCLPLKLSGLDGAQARAILVDELE